MRTRGLSSSRWIAQSASANTNAFADSVKWKGEQLLAPQQQHHSSLWRCTLTTSATSNTTTNANVNNDDHPTHLLTRATARQLKGDVSEAIALAARAISLLKQQQQQQQHQVEDETHKIQEEVADAIVFMGKLYRLQGASKDSVESFSEALELYRDLQVHQSSDATRRKELVALSHRASSRALSPACTASIASANDDFREALLGLEALVGWGDGMTNHTAHEWSLLCRSTGNPEEALSILQTMKREISRVFGNDDHRVLQLHGELAELWQLVSIQKEADGDAERSDEGDSGHDDSATTAIGAEDHAMALLEEALEKLPPNSPEARRIFMQLEDWKEQKEQREQREGEEEENQNASTARGTTVVVTNTQGRGDNS